MHVGADGLCGGARVLESGLLRIGQVEGAQEPHRAVAAVAEAAHLVAGVRPG